MEKEKQNNNRLLLQYASLGSQLLISLGIATYAGYLIDKWLKAGFPLLIWALPLIVLIFTMLKIMRDTSKNKNE